VILSLPLRFKRLIRPVVSDVRVLGATRMEPYHFLEAHTERLFWRYVGSDPASITSIVIVGAWQGAEIAGLLSRYQNATVVAFEPSPHNFAHLAGAHGSTQRVRLFQEAVSDHAGVADFHEANLPGTGSLLPLSKLADARTHNQGLASTESFKVPVATLDSHPATGSLVRVDLLKVDVQGAELKVLNGGRALLERTTAVLVEVGLTGSAYDGAAMFTDVDTTLRAAGLKLCGLGLDPITLDGNALYARITSHE
jgi:FkbM family methyltransferase